MAHENLAVRRKFVAEKIADGCKMTPVDRKEIAKIFGCSRAAIYADFVTLTVDFFGDTWHISKEMRQRIKERDNHVCQYCGDENPENPAIEHVIPYLSGGVAREYNLVFSCTFCNSKKRSKVWAPSNLNEITKNHLEWRNKILAMASPFDLGIRSPAKKRLTI